MELLISIIVPAYKAGGFIGRALEAVRTQTHSHWELIVVEDGSHDETELLVQGFGQLVTQRVVYENNGKNMGVSATRNRAMALARGDVIAFLDADDWWTPEHLTRGLETLESGADLCFSGFQLFDEATKAVSNSEAPSEDELRKPMVSLFKRNFIQTSSIVMLRRPVMESNGGFDSLLKVGEDMDYWLRALGAGYVLKWTARPTCFYYKHPQSAMAKSLMVAEESVRFRRKHLSSAFLPVALRKAVLADCLFQQARLTRAAEPRRAAGLFAEAWLQRPLNGRYAFYAAASAFQGCFRRA